MKRSQLKQIIKQIIKEQVGEPEGTYGTPPPAPGGSTNNQGNIPTPSSCCSAIQALKPYIPLPKKQFYLDALEDCGCNEGPQIVSTQGLSSLSTPGE